MITLGIDPGLTGAFALYDPTPSVVVPPAPHILDADPTLHYDKSGKPFLWLWDMPTIDKEVSGKPRKIIDPGGLSELVDLITNAYSVDRIVIEEVGGMPGQSASAAFNFGFGVGLLHMAFRYRGLQFDVVRPSAWKKAVKAPSDKKLAVQRADEVFPWARDKWRSPRVRAGKDVAGTNDMLHHDRAEAALLAYWAAGGVA